MQIENRKTAELIPYERNPRHNDEAVAAVAASIKEFGFKQPIVIDAESVVIAGHTRLKAAQRLGLEEVPCVIASDLSEQQIKAYRLLDNRVGEKATWDNELLQLELEDLDSIDWSAFDVDWNMLQDEPSESSSSSDISAEQAALSLAERFMVPPFTVLDARQGWWQKRRKQWLSLGIKSEIGRDENLLGFSKTVLESGSGSSGTSIFNPVLAELIYRWFFPIGGRVLDPFAGGSVRGIVASKLGRIYHGVELRPEQVKANIEQGEALCTEELRPTWHQGDSMQIRSLCKGLAADLLFSCPPYGDLESYSDLPEDISTMPYEKFLEAYSAIIERSCSLLKENSFACFVVGDIRDKQGKYRNFVSQTIEAFQKAGLRLYNEAILVTPVATLALRVGRSFPVSRKLGKCHQNVLVFCKGDAAAAAAACGAVDVEVIKELEASAEDELPPEE